MYRISENLQVLEEWNGEGAAMTFEQYSSKSYEEYHIICITNDKASYVAKEDRICLFSFVKEAALNEQRRNLVSLWFL